MDSMHIPAGSGRKDVTSIITTSSLTKLKNLLVELLSYSAILYHYLSIFVSQVLISFSPKWCMSQHFDKWHLALLFVGNTCLIGKSTTHKMPQSADVFAL